jgi:hypothetical protein
MSKRGNFPNLSRRNGPEDFKFLASLGRGLGPAAFPGRNLKSEDRSILDKPLFSIIMFRVKDSSFVLHALWALSAVELDAATELTGSIPLFVLTA